MTERVGEPIQSETRQGIVPQIKLGRRRTPFSKSVLTRETEILSTRTRDAEGKPIKGTGLKRGPVTRFERGEIVRAYRLIRGQIDDATQAAAVNFASGQDEAGFQALEVKLGAKDFLAKFRRKARKTEADLDILNRQLYDNEKRISIDDPELGGKHEVSVIILDLKSPEERAKDPRPTIVNLPGFLSNAHNDAAFSMAWALAGYQVGTIANLGNEMSVSPADWLRLMGEDGTLRLHANLNKQVIHKLQEDPNPKFRIGKKISLVGTSRGAAVALEMASDPSFETEDVVVAEPVTVIDKGTAKQIVDFMIREGIGSMLTAEKRAKAVASETFPTVSKQPSLLEIGKVLGPILSKRQITDEKLTAINPRRSYQIWLGADSKVTGGEATMRPFIRMEKERRRLHPDAIPLEVHMVEGGHHDMPYSHSLGLVYEALGNHSRTRKEVTRHTLDGLSNSAAQSILRGEKAA